MELKLTGTGNQKTITLISIGLMELKLDKIIRIIVVITISIGLMELKHDGSFTINCLSIYLNRTYGIETDFFCPA